MICIWNCRKRTGPTGVTPSLVIRDQYGGRDVVVPETGYHMVYLLCVFPLYNEQLQQELHAPENVHVGLAMDVDKQIPVVEPKSVKFAIGMACFLNPS